MNVDDKKKLDPFDGLVLDAYEQEIEDSFDASEWKPSENAAEMKEMFRDAALRHNELEKSKQVTLRVNQSDLIKLKVKAKKKNIPYQTLLGVLIRDFVDGKYAVKL